MTERKWKGYIFGTLVVGLNSLMLERGPCIFFFICTYNMMHEHDRWNMNMIGENIENLLKSGCACALSNDNYVAIPLISRLWKDSPGA